MEMAKKPKTKIVCTLGPASRSVPMIEKLLSAGMNVARFSFSHGSHAYHQETLDNLKAAMLNAGILCAVMLDTKGPEIQTGFLKDEKIQLKQGQDITITTDYSIKGDEKLISMSYKKLAEDVKPGMVILCADGTISFTVLSCDKQKALVHCRYENSAVLGERKNVNLPGVIVDLPTLTDKDKEDILEWGIPNQIDMIALSFVRKGSDLWRFVSCLESMLRIFFSCRSLPGQPGLKPLMLPMQFLVAQTVMLSGETAAGAYSELAVWTMAKICVEAESTLDYGDVFKRIMEYSPVPMSPLESLASSAVRTANSAKAALILVLTRGGSTAKLVAKYRLGMPILSVVVPEVKTDSFDWSCSDETPARHSLVFRGLIPVLYAGSARASHEETTEEALDFAVQHAKAKGLCQSGDSIVALHRIGTASVIKILTVK
ncbi:hypothetical protein CRYUN_Cryun02cG0124600 [Craigia yunnanensis]